MKLISGFDEGIYKAICKRSGSKQAIKDASYMRPVIFRGAEVYAERLDEIACLFGYFNKTDLHIVCVAVDKDYQGHGYGAALLLRALEAAKKRGLSKVATRTSSGVNFYKEFGFTCVGRKKEDYVMEVIV